MLTYSIQIMARMFKEKAVQTNCALLFNGENNIIKISFNECVAIFSSDPKCYRKKKTLYYINLRVHCFVFFSPSYNDNF